MPATLAPTPTVALALRGHQAALKMNGELAIGKPLPKFGDVQVDAVLTAVQEQETAQYGGVYAMGDFKATVSKGAFPNRPAKGTLCMVRDAEWKVKDPILETSTTYQIPITRFLR